MVAVRFGKGCEIVLDEEFRDVRVSDGRTAIVKVVFDEDWKIREVPVNDIYVSKSGLSFDRNEIRENGHFSLIRDVFGLSGIWPS